jgi:hypothetical protein
MLSETEEQAEILQAQTLHVARGSENNVFMQRSGTSTKDRERSSFFTLLGFPPRSVKHSPNRWFNDQNVVCGAGRTTGFLCFAVAPFPSIHKHENRGVLWGYPVGGREDL